MIRFVTTNEGKFREVEQLLGGYQVPIERLDRRYPEVQADTLEEVVLYALDVLGREFDDFFVDDSGLFVDALRGFPGVYSSHTFRKLGVAGLSCLMHGMEDRRARFETVLGGQFEGERHLVKGQCFGTVAGEARGLSGFGFDPIFVPEGHTATFAEMSTEEKNAVSHRGNATRALAALIARR